MSDYRPALETSEAETDRDTPTQEDLGSVRAADDLWLWFSRGVASRPRVRIARNGREYRRSWEANLDPRNRPRRPAAVRTYDGDGKTHCVVFDLDAKKPGQRGAVLRDCERLTAWLSEAGCAWFVDESPSGGRHVYVPLAEPLPHGEVAPLLKGLRAAGTLPTLDPAPMSNLTEGCIRPPGSTHKSGGHQRLVTEVHRAAAALHTRTSPESWIALLRQMPTPEVTQDDTYRLLRAVPDQPVPGIVRPLSPYYALIAVTGQFDSARYASPSEARYAVITHAIGHGWSESEIKAEMTAGRWPGLVKLYADKYGRYAQTAIFGRGDQVKGDIKRAHEFVTANPLHRSLTSATRPRRGQTGSALQLHLRRWNAAVHLAVAEGRWSSKLSYGRENVLTSLVSAARQVRSEVVEHGARHLSYTGGTVLEWASVAAHLRALRAEDDPFVLLVEQSQGASADVYELVIPDAYADRLPPDDQLEPLPRGIHPVFGKLSAPAHRAYTALKAAGRALKAAELAEAAHMPARTAWAVLAEMEAHHLTIRGGGGLWRVGRRTLDRVARELGVARRLRDLVQTWRLERDAWRITLGLPARELAPARNVAWPGRPPSPAPLAAPARAPLTREQELKAIGGGLPDWRTDLEEATALLLLQTVLGAELLTDRDPPAEEVS